MLSLTEKVGTLTVLGLSRDGNYRAGGRPVLILGNAYGMMDYQMTLATALANDGWEPWTFAFSGQKRGEGIFSGHSGVNDIAVVLQRLSEMYPGVPIKVVAHCAGALMALECLTRRDDLPVDRMIVYGLLFHPARRRAHAEMRFKKLGIAVSLGDDEWEYSPLPALEKIRIPIMFCHARDELNLLRATSEEMAAAVRATRFGQVEWFDKGYDEDLSQVPRFAECYNAWLKSASIPISAGVN